MKFSKKITALSIFMLTAFTAFGQDCDGLGVPGGGDIDAVPAGCPLDTWIIVLAAVTLLFTVLHLHRKQKLNTRNLLYKSN